ncbi:gephyrin-like molybdotransferase Glp [Nocardioides sp. R-C-SC26]|uniref:molybdotransferase-like divisome protein Glp n=1 Tax=Nocardioides sp. R-C-SC26 TaxID=2870414 RepID=UPI001E37AE81|nr:gephyrin-like molybdotransferase Glp [Nocardioides sp. R-C-SC26]
MPDGLRSVEEHLDAILGEIEPLADFAQPLIDALDLVCTEEIVAPIRLPRFDNSAMDGYAVRAEDVATAAEESPVKMRVVGEIGAGQGNRLSPGGARALPEGTAVKIMTGAPMPRNADCVIPYEWTDRGVDQVWIAQSAHRGQHVRYAGEDVALGDLLIEPGTQLGPRQLGLLASVGRNAVRVRPRPRVLIVSTGSELRDPGAELAPDSIYDGNSYLLAAAARRAGCVPSRAGALPDDPTSFLAGLAAKVGSADVVVTSGGISMGDYDVVKEALGGDDEVWFGGVAMQPGKPQGFGHLRVGADERRVPFFALPGNPVSAYLSFEIFVRPALRRMMGIAPESRQPITARITHDVRSPYGRRQFLRGTLTDAGGHRSVAEVVPVGGSGSHLVGDLSASDCVIVVPEREMEIAAGSMVSVIRLDD